MNEKNEVMQPSYKQGLRYYHPSASGRGAALQLEPHFSNQARDRYNCFFLEMAAQQTSMGSSSDSQKHATFNWQDKLTVKLDFTDICELLVVLEGRSQRVGGARGGLFHQHGDVNTIISCQKGDKSGYLLGLSRKDMQSGRTKRIHMLLSEAEAVGLRHVLQSSLFFLSFHQHLFGLWAANAKQ